MQKVVFVTGGFDPIHSGHLAYFNEAKKLGDKLVVGINSDEWLTRKKGKPFMPYSERLSIIQNLKMVDHVVSFDDSDDTACGAIFKVMCTIGHDSHIIFANGGDRKQGTVPEERTYTNKVEFVYGVGGTDKLNSSSWILQEYKQPKTNRNWGYYRVLHEDGPEVKVKELTVMPGQKLSMQRHQERSEHWFVSQGTATVYTLNVSTDVELHGTFNTHQSLHIPATMWHQLSNETEKPLKLVEIQYGTNCIEEDIERK